MNEPVLIVDDSLTVRMDLLETLKEAGIGARACANASDARAVLAANAFALVILDVLLPDGDGIEILKEIRESAANAGTWVMLLSTEADVRDRIRGFETGADEYIGKPYQTDYVLARVREILRARKPEPLPTQEAILVIDDSITFREELRSALEDEGFRVATAGDGEEGLRAAADMRPSAVVVDGVLPGIDGATVVRRIRLDVGLRRTPCLLLTAAEGRGAELEALEAGADAFVRKEEDIPVILARLRAVLRSAGSRPIDQVAASPLGPKKILAVDDSETYLQQLAEVLRGDGYEVVLARSGAEALETLALQPVDCVLLDLVMPGMSGQDACRLIKSNPGLRDTPIVMLTAREDKDAIIEGLGAGADDYIVKSGDFQVLKARVLAQLRRKQFEDENRRIREDMLRRELEAAEVRAARELAETRAALVDELERKNLELAAASLAKSNFLANMSHEIRTPMNAVIGLSELALRTELSPKQRDYLTKIKASTRTLLGVINDILDLSKIEAGKLTLESTEFEMRAVLDDLAAVSALAAAEKGLELMFSVDPALPRLLEGDPLHLGQVLHNLVANAVKFTDNGEVVVTIRVASREPDAVVLEISVSDTGMGMTAETQAKLFQPFTQADESTTRRFGGSGLGLAISRQLVAMMGGTIAVKSTPGEGSVFSFSVALGVATPPDGQTQPADPATLEGMRILIADDSARSRQILETMLGHWGMQVVAVNSGNKAAAVLREALAQGRSFDLVLLDWQMPEKDGLATAALMESEIPLASLPKIIMMTAYGRDDLAEAAKDAAPIAGFLAKPISHSTLLDAISSALGRNGGGVRHRLADTFATGHSPILGANVLLVDDNDINRQVGAETLANAGTNVDLATSGEEAIAKVLAPDAPYDVVLMDVQMPGMDGLEATRLIRKQVPASRLPIIALTAHAFEQQRALCLAAGMNDHIAKPIDPVALVATLARWIKTNGRESRPAQRPTTLEATGTKRRADADPGGDLPASLPPFDIPAALVRLGGNRPALRRLILMFGKEFSGAGARFREAARDGKFNDAEILAHTLKSTAASLAAHDVSKAARDIEECLKKNQTTVLLDLVEHLDQVLAPALAASQSLERSRG